MNRFAKRGMIVIIIVVAGLVLAGVLARWARQPDRGSVLEITFAGEIPEVAQDEKLARLLVPADWIHPHGDGFEPRQTGGQVPAVAGNNESVGRDNQGLLDAEFPDTFGQGPDFGVPGVQGPVEFLILGGRLN